MKTDKQKAKILVRIDAAVGAVALLGVAAAAIGMSGGRLSLPLAGVLLVCFGALVACKIMMLKRLNQAFQFYEGVLDAIPFMIHSTDVDMRWKFFNKATAEFLGLDREASVGKHCSNWNAAICGTTGARPTACETATPPPSSSRMGWICGWTPTGCWMKKATR